MMKLLDLKPTHKAVAAYYAELQQLAHVDAQREGAVSPAFANLLRHCAKQFNWTLYEQYPLKVGNKNIYPDGALVDTAFPLPYGYWEAKKTQVALEEEIRQKFAKGYPQENILFQTPARAVLYQDGRLRLDTDLTQPAALVEILKAFFEYQPPEYEEWQQAVEAFKAEVPKIGQGVLELIERERQTNKGFKQAFEKFTAICREAINPNISVPAVEEMLIQHLFTARILQSVFQNTDFVNLNIVAREIENVVRALVFPHGGRHEFFKPLDRFYRAIEIAAATLSDFAQKQAFLNTVYEKFFQGFSVKVADTHGIVYTPQPIVQFMVNSIAEILNTEFGRSLSDDGVHILDPFVGTGNFMLHVMQKIRKTALAHKYRRELHCNEVMLLPYYIAALNIEHEYLTLAGEYQPFDGICFVDTFELAEEKQLSLFSAENTARVARQKKAPIFVILGNPPYNAGQVNENDNNKNRKYPVMDKRVSETYAKGSAATNKNALSDVYIKAIRWAADRILKNGEGIVAFVTNSGFLDGIAFDRMRKQLTEDFDAIYVLDLGGNVRKNPKLSGTTHNVFGIQVGVSINLLVKKQKSPRSSETSEIWYARLDEFWRKAQKYRFLEQARDYRQIDWQPITPDKKQNWLNEGMSEDFDNFLPMGTQETKKAKTTDVESIFKLFSNGVSTNRDAWAYNFNAVMLKENIQRCIETYHYELYRWQNRTDKTAKLDDFVLIDDAKIKWSSHLKECLLRGQATAFLPEKIRISLYRPYSLQFLFFDAVLVHRRFQFHQIFPSSSTEAENRVICVTGISNSKPFQCLMTNVIPDLHLTGDSQCFPFYTYAEDGSNRRENITDWALAQFRARYATTPPAPSPKSGEGNLSPSPNLGEGGVAPAPDSWEGRGGVRAITKWDIFYYVYALLHHPHYRTKYAANLKRALPRIPFVGCSSRLRSTNGDDRLLSEVEAFWAFAEAGRKLAELHVNYEQQPKYPLQFIETGDLNWRVEKMKLSKDRTQIVYNHFLTLAGIPPETFEYTLGNKSALHWILDQYQVSTDTRSGITNDPNRADEPDYIVKLIQRVVTVSVETVKIVNALPELAI